MLKTLSALIAFAIVGLIVAAAGLMPARAQDLLAKPTGVAAVDGAAAGTVTVSWNAVAEASFYRIGWVSADDLAAVRAQGRNWLDAFVFSDVASQGQTSYTVLRLAPGVRHAFIVGSLNSRFSNAAWSEWAYLTTAETTAQCPPGGGEPPPPTAAPVPTPTPAPDTTPTPGATGTPTPEPSATLLPTPTPRPTAAPRPSATATPTPAPTPTPSPTPTPTPTPVAVGTDYDQDNDGLIEIANLAQLDAIRHDLNGDGVSTNADGYAAAFPNPAAGMGCARQQCRGYELAANLDFDTDGNGQINKGDTYWDDGNGWSPIGGVSSPFNTVLDGNSRTIANLHIDRTDTDHIGLFGAAGGNAIIRNVRLTEVRVSGGDKVGALAGSNSGSISGSRAAGRVSGDGGIGGLAGVNSGSISSSNAAVAVSGSSTSSDGQAALGVFGSGNSVGGLAGVNPGTIADSHASGAVTGGGSFIGGLVGSGSNSSGSCGTISRSYATGKVTGNGAREGHFVGGLIGSSCGAISGSHATGAVTGAGLNIGGLVGVNGIGSAISSSYAAGAVTGYASVGGLVGGNRDAISGSYATGKVSATGGLTGSSYVGGLVGLLFSGPITASYATGSVTGNNDVGGLVGSVTSTGNSGGSITASYATGSVTGNTRVGGLVGAGDGYITSITASYAIGRVTGASDVGGLVGRIYSGLEVTGSYWDTQTTGQTGSDGGKTTRELQQPTAATGIYADWNAEHWDFGTAKQYPALKYRGMDVGQQRR